MIALLLAAILSWHDAPVEVGPSELAKRADLVGREIVVDGRVAYFQSHEGVFDELFLKKTPIAFRLPADLQSRRNPDGATARVQGVLKKESGGLVVDVTNLRMLPADADRLRQGLALLSPNDADGRFAWARWARYRAQEFGEPALTEKAGELDGEAIRIEANRAGGESTAGSLRLAKKARDLGVPEPEPSALAHRGFRLKLAEARSSADFAAIVAEIEAFLPDSRDSSSAADLAAWVDSYQADPAASYRLVPATLRAAFDRKLWADAVAGSLERRFAERPETGLAVAQEARDRLPDRPALADRVEKAALDRVTDDEHLSSLRRDDLQDLSRRLIARGQPDQAQSLKRRWLEDQRRRKLRPGDAEGRVLLAEQFEAMIGDRTSAVSLLKEAWAIDPQSKTTADAFRRLGFRKVDDEWQPTSAAVASPAAKRAERAGDSPEAAADEPTGDPLRNLTRSEVRTRLGDPGRIVRSATQAGILEQWVYPGPRRSQFVNFFFRPGMPQPLVRRSYSVATP